MHSLPIQERWACQLSFSRVKNRTSVYLNSNVVPLQGRGDGSLSQADCPDTHSLKQVPFHPDPHEGCAHQQLVACCLVWALWVHHSKTLAQPPVNLSGKRGVQRCWCVVEVTARLEKHLMGCKYCDFRKGPKGASGTKMPVSVAQSCLPEYVWRLQEKQSQ